MDQCSLKPVETAADIRKLPEYWVGPVLHLIRLAFLRITIERGAPGPLPAGALSGGQAMEKKDKTEWLN
jgi:hypothetical protein